MASLDYIVLAAYIAAIFVIGGIFGRRIKTSSDLFAAGGQAPWWVSGTSGFMTMFSAGTFVVWGGIAYRLGGVAISISLCYGVAALLVGYWIAGRWKEVGVTTAAEFIQLRFGKAALQFYTWTGITYKMIGTGVALYAVSILLAALVPLPEGFLFRDPATGNLALTWAILLFGGVVVVYTVVGGLWAVLMTDVLQFIVLLVVVTLLVPLIFAHPEVGGMSGFVAQAPEGFFLPTAGEFTWVFLAGWVAIHFFMIGAEWAFAQRFICVPSAKDARKSAWLFGVLYLTSPIFWMLPPMVYRIVNPDADPQEAYILACREVLPVGILGLMLAAMLSATASLVDSQLNVFSGVLTRDFFARWRKKASEALLVFAGRIITVLLGGVVIGLALLVPYLGGAERVTLTVASLMVGPLLAPTVWGLLSPRIDARAVWWTAGLSFLAGATVTFGLRPDGLLEVPLAPLAAWVQANQRVSELMVGVLFPVIILAIHEWRVRGISSGWKAVEEHVSLAAGQPQAASTLPGKIVGANTVALGLLLLAIAAAGEDSPVILWMYGAVLAVLGITALYFSRSKGPSAEDETAAGETGPEGTRPQ